MGPSVVRNTILATLVIGAISAGAGAGSAAGAEGVKLVGPYALTLHQGSAIPGPLPTIGWFGPAGWVYTSYQLRTISGEAPAGVTVKQVAPNTLTLSGTPTQAGTWSFEVEAEAAPKDCASPCASALKDSHTYKVITKPTGIEVALANPAASSVTGGVHAPVPWQLEVVGLPVGYTVASFQLQGTIPQGVSSVLKDGALHPPPNNPLPHQAGSGLPSSSFWWIEGAPAPGTEGSYKFEAVATAKQAGCAPCGPDLTAHVKLSLVVEAEAKKLKIEPGSLLVGAVHGNYHASLRASGSHTGCYAFRPVGVTGADPQTGVLGTIDGLQLATSGATTNLVGARWWIQCAYADEASLELSGAPTAAGKFPLTVEVAELGCSTGNELCPKAVTRNYTLKVEPVLGTDLGLYTQAGPVTPGEPVALVEGETIFDMFENGEIGNAHTLDCVEESLQGTMSAPNPGNELKLALTSSSFVGDEPEAQECKLFRHGKIDQYLGGRVTISTNQSVSNPWLLSVSSPVKNAYLGRSEGKLSGAEHKLAITAHFVEDAVSCTWEAAAMTGFIYPGLAELYVQRTKAPGVAASPWKLNTRVSNAEECPPEAEFSGAFSLVLNPQGLEPEQLQLIG